MVRPCILVGLLAHAAASANDHITHNNLERVHTSKLRVHPKLLAEENERDFSGRVRSSLSSRPAVRGTENAVLGSSLPTLEVDQRVVFSCVGGRVHVTFSSGPDFVRNASDWIGLYRCGGLPLEERV